MNSRMSFLLFALGMLVLANLLMAYGFTNTSNARALFIENFVNNGPKKNEGFANSKEKKEGFANFVLDGAGIKTDYQPIGQYDGIIKRPENGISTWRSRPANEPLINNAPEFQPGPDQLFIFANNQAKPECCGSSFSCSTGCVCTTKAQRDFINMRGGNRTVDDGF